jgi:integrase
MGQRSAAINAEKAARKRGKRMARKTKRRQSQGLPWHWKQTDSWYYTLPGTKRRVALFDEDGQRIKGLENKQAAQLALSRIKLQGDWEQAPISAPGEEWLVARVCSDYLQYCERGAKNGQLSQAHYDSSKSLLNDLCRYCGALPVAQLKKGHVKNWMDSHAGWKSPASYRNAIAVVLAAFNRAEDDHDVTNPLKGLKKPRSEPRLQSFTKEEEHSIYKTTDEPFRNFLFAAIHTGLRPYCELAKITADDVTDSGRGMMWKVYSSKTKKTRKVPVLPQVAELTRALIKTAPAGSGMLLFRNPAGNRWKKGTGVMRMLKIRRDLGWDKHPTRKKYSSYTCRHTFAHRMLSGYWNGGVGCSIEVLAELIGDTPKVAFDHYGKEWGQFYQEPLWAAVGLGQPAPATAKAKPSHRQGQKRPRRKTLAKG